MNTEEVQQPTNDPKPAPNGANEPTFTQSQLEAIIKDRLERQKRANESAAAKAAEEARLKALAENQEWKAVAEQHEAALNAAKAQLSTLERYEQTLAAQLEREKAGLPQYILDLLAEKSLVDQLDYLAKHGKSLRPQTEVPAPNLNGAVKPAKPVPDAKARVEELARRFPSLKVNK